LVCRSFTHYVCTSLDKQHKNMESFLRDWARDALEKHNYETAIFVGDKLYARTSTF